LQRNILRTASTTAVRQPRNGKEPVPLACFIKTARHIDDLLVGDRSSVVRDHVVVHAVPAEDLAARVPKGRELIARTRAPELETEQIVHLLERSQETLLRCQAREVEPVCEEVVGG